MPRTVNISPRYITHAQAVAAYGVDTNAQRFKKWCLQQGIGVVQLPGRNKPLRFNAQHLAAYFKNQEIAI